MKAVIRLLLMVGTFLLFWFLLAQVNWMEHLGVNKITQSTEEKLSEFVREQIERSEDVIKDEEVNKIIDSLVHIISKANGIDADLVNVMTVNNQQINAFALPTDYLVINSGLINACESPEALCGVIAHELSHIRLNHVKKKLLKELGVAVLVSSTSGGGGEVIRQVTKILSSNTYDRSLEIEADEQAVDYLLKAQIDPEAFAEFFYKLSFKEPDFMPQLEWISTHADSKERAANIVEKIAGKDVGKRPVLHVSSWKRLKELINSEMD